MAQIASHMKHFICVAGMPHWTLVNADCADRLDVLELAVASLGRLVRYWVCWRRAKLGTDRETCAARERVCDGAPIGLTSLRMPRQLGYCPAPGYGRLRIARLEKLRHSVWGRNRRSRAFRPPGTGWCTSPRRNLNEAPEDRRAGLQGRHCLSARGGRADPHSRRNSSMIRLKRSQPPTAKTACPFSPKQAAYSTTAIALVGAGRTALIGDWFRQTGSGGTISPAQYL
jgi:hypothetical protein